MPGGHPRLLLGLEERVEQPDPLGRESPGIDPAVIDRPADQVDEPRKVCLSLARAEVDAESRPVDRLAVDQAGILDGLGRDGQRNLGVPAVALPPGRVAAEVPRQVEPFQLGRDPRRERVGLEERDRTDPATALADASHEDSTSSPTGVTNPIPVTTTRLPARSMDITPDSVSRSPQTPRGVPSVVGMPGEAAGL